MTININPNYINVQNQPARNSADRALERRREKAGSAVPKPTRVEENFIPEPESLATIIRNAIASLRQGIVWDRGTILNLVV